MSDDFMRLFLDDDGNLPNRYVTTKTIKETLQDLYNQFSSLEVDWATPTLEDFRHVSQSTECEALYFVRIPQIDGFNKNGTLVSLNNVELEDFYEQAIIRQPRSIY
tara:strand:+ start:395 stop:712 length:318 start_codon:yes stop_codon:yes gene_type:complete